MAMSEVFYRKWRPQTLGKVVGQEPVTQTLRQAVTLGRIAHAYLFCGPRGTGKTSTARILAKAVNCLSPHDGEPDNECTMCRAINEGRALDLIEIDAASNRGIDDVRNLNDKVRFAPNEARYKVYIVDEVHMMTEPAFNALLKTLEEPPEHAIFVLATTEAHKVPPTIISRCQRFDFRRIPSELIVEKLGEVCGEEGIEASPEALALIARMAKGSLRDAENLLEQAALSYGSPLGEGQVRDLLGLHGDEVALELVQHLIGKSVPEGLTVISRVVGEGGDLGQLYRGVMEHLRGVLLVRAGAETSLGYPNDAMALITSLANDISMEHLLHTIRVFGKVDLRRDSFSALPLELAVVESATVAPPVVQETRPPVAVNRELPRASASPSPSLPRPGTPAPSPNDRPDRSTSRRDSQSEIRTGTPDSVPSEPLARLESQWNSILRSLRHTGRRFKLGALLRGCKEREISDGLITLRFPYMSHVERMREELEDPETRRALKDVLRDEMDGPYEVEVSLVDEGSGGRQQSAALRSHLVRAAQAMGARVVDEKEEES